MTAALDDWPAETLTGRLRVFAKQTSVREVDGCTLDDLIAEAAEVEQDAAMFRDAAHMLHEQAHGNVPWITCQIEPCPSLVLGDEDRGPAPLTLP